MHAAARCCCAAIACLAAVLAQGQATERVARVGVMLNAPVKTEPRSGPGAHPAVGTLVEGLQALGWTEGRNLRLEWRFADGDFTRLPKMAEALVAERVDVIVAYGPGIEAALRATDRIPVVAAVSGIQGELVVDGRVRVASFARPGGNVTGSSIVSSPDLAGKKLAILKETVPRARRIGVVGASGFRPQTRAAAEALGLELRSYGYADKPGELEAAFDAMARDRIDAVIVAETPQNHEADVQRQIHALARRHRLPALYDVVDAVDTGGLMAYGFDVDKLYRRVPFFVDRILRGAKPGEIPIEQPTGYELRINLGAARAIGLAFPQSLRVRAERVVE